MHNDVNIRSAKFLLARTAGTCRYCGALTPLAALVVPPGHMALELDDETQDEQRAVDAWRIATGSAFIFFVGFIPPAVQRRLRQFTRLYRLNGEPGASSYWANHCERCDGSIDDNELHCEPDGAFVPTTPESATLIHLATIEQAFEAAAGGYAYEPAWFCAMRQDAGSWPSTT